MPALTEDLPPLILLPGFDFFTFPWVKISKANPLVHLIGLAALDNVIIISSRQGALSRRLSLKVFAKLSIYLWTDKA